MRNSSSLVLAALTALVAVFLCQPSYAAVETADLVCESTATTGTGTVNLGGAATGYLGFVAGGISNGATVPYTIRDGASFESGWGTFTDSTPDTLTRTATNSSDGVGSELNLSGSATVCVGPVASYFRRAYRVAEFFWYTGSTCPAGSLTANGAEVSRTTYADLWAAISGDAVATGSKSDADYSTGDTSTTFELMDLTNQYAWIVAAGSTPATYGSVLESAAPDIDGSVNLRGGGNSGTGAISVSGFSGSRPANGANDEVAMTFAASADEATYSDSVSEISVPSIPMTPCIVY